MANIISVNFYLKHIQVLGLIFIAVSICAWSVDLLGLVYVCPYCRMQRSVIGILGLFMVLKAFHNAPLAFFASVIGFLGAHVAAAQHFMGWKSISKGTFEFKENLFIDPFLLSGAALCLIIFQVWVLILSTRANIASTLQKGS